MANIIERKVITCSQNCGAEGHLTIWSCGCQGYTFVKSADSVDCSAHDELYDFQNHRQKCGQLGWAGDHTKPVVEKP